MIYSEIDREVFRGFAIAHVLDTEVQKVVAAVSNHRRGEAMLYGGYDEEGTLQEVLSIGKNGGRDFYVNKNRGTCMEGPDKSEAIVCAAVRYKVKGDADWHVVYGKRHSDCMHKFCDLGLKSSERTSEVQGFLTTEGRFVDRCIAMRLAHRANQLRDTHQNKSELTSEDIY